ncbi:MAG: hypothetical protein VCC04_10040 [Myxococcota bacterium]
MQKRLFLVALFSASIALCALAYPAFTASFYNGTDLDLFHIPVRAFYQNALLNENAFLWYPYSFRGYYIHAESQSAFYHPLNLLSYKYLSFAAAFNLEFIRSYIFLLGGGLFPLLRMGLGLGPAMFGSLIFAFSGFNLLHYMHLNVVGAIAHIPWLLLAIDVVIRSPNRVFVALATLAIVLLTASSLLLGHPQFVWISVLIQVLYAVFLLVSRRSLFSTISLRLIAAQLLGLACAGIQILPLSDGVLDSGRSTATMASGGFRNFPALIPLDFSQLVAPYLIVSPSPSPTWLVESYFYCGSLLPVMFVWLLLRWSHLESWKPWVGFWIAVFALSAWLGLGNEGGLYQVQALMPVINLFRGPARYTVLAQLAAAILVAIAFADLCRSPARELRGTPLPWLFVPAVVSGIVTALVLLTSSAADVNFAGHIWRVAAGPLLLALAAVLVAAAARQFRGALSLIILFGCADIAYYGLSFVWLDQPVSLEQYTEQALEVHEAAGMPGLDGYRVLGFTDAEAATALFGVRKFWGYRALVRQEDTELLETLSEHHLDQKTVITNSPLLSVSSVDLGTLGDSEYEAMPRVRLVTRAVQSDSPYEAMLSIDPVTTAVMDEEVKLSPAPAGTAEIIDEEPGFLHVLTDSGSEQLLIVSESFHEGWQARSGAEPKEVFRAYGGLMAMLVGPGRQETVLRFEPKTFVYGKWLSWSGLATALLWFLYDLWRSRTLRPSG